MTAEVLQDLMAELMIFIVSSTGYSAVPDLPEVAPITRPRLEQRVCGKPCPVLALFDPEQGILVDESLDLVGDPAAQSVVLHELVHFLQWNAAGRPASQCDEWLAREREAYRVQFAWLSSLDFDWRDSGLSRPVLSLIRCQPERLQASEKSGIHAIPAASPEGRAHPPDRTIRGRH